MSKMYWTSYGSPQASLWSLEDDSGDVQGFVRVNWRGGADAPVVTASRPAHGGIEPVMENRAGFRSVEDAKAWVMEAFTARRSAAELKQDAVKRELLAKVRELWGQLMDDNGLSVSSAWFGEEGCHILTVRRNDLKRTSPEALAERYYRAYFGSVAK